MTKSKNALDANNITRHAMASMKNKEKRLSTGEKGRQTASKKVDQI